MSFLCKVKHYYFSQGRAMERIFNPILHILLVYALMKNPILNISSHTTAYTPILISEYTAVSTTGCDELYLSMILMSFID